VKLRETEGVSAVVSLNEEVRDPARQHSSRAAPLCPSMAGDWSNWQTQQFFILTMP